MGQVFLCHLWTFRHFLGNGPPGGWNRKLAAVGILATLAAAAAAKCVVLVVGSETSPLTQSPTVLSSMCAGRTTHAGITRKGETVTVNMMAASSISWILSIGQSEWYQLIQGGPRDGQWGRVGVKSGGEQPQEAPPRGTRVDQPTTKRPVAGSLAGAEAHFWHSSPKRGAGVHWD